MKRKRTLNVVDLVLFTFSAMFGVEAISSAASLGPSGISWWIICAIIFLIPLGFISAELGATYPDQGGLYVWTKRALGKKWAARITWFYWISLPLWIPAIYISVSEILKHMFFVEIGLWTEVAICIVLIWATVLVNLFSLSISKWLPNMGSMASFIIILGAILAAIIFLVNNGKSANDINLINILPSLDASVVFIPMILYHFFGFEIITGVAGEMKNPTRDIPRSIIISAFILVLFYLAVMTAMWIVIPVDEINATSGVFDIFSRTFGNTMLGDIISMVLGFFIIFTLFTAVVAWTLGQNRVVAEAAINGDMPKTLGKINKKTMVPVGAAIVSGLISTSVILLYGIVAKDAAGLFWNILSFSTIACLFSYVILFPVYIILRKKDAKIKRPYQVPGPEWFKISTAVVAEIFTLLTMVVLLIQPGEDFLESSLPVIFGTIITIIVGEIIIKHPMKHKKRT